MKITNYGQKVELGSAYFDAMRRDLDGAIKSCIEAMNRQNINTGSVGLKIDIEAYRVSKPDRSALDGFQETIVPNINYKVTLALQSKEELKGRVVGEDHEIVQDDTGAFFILTKEEAEGQLNMFSAELGIPWDSGANDVLCHSQQELEELDAEDFKWRLDKEDGIGGKKEE